MNRSLPESVHHYTLLTFEHDAIVGRMVRLDGSSGDTFRLDHDGGP